ncbi:MAG: M48 family metalloprotease [Pseudomonadota bacterium]
MAGTFFVSVPKSGGLELNREDAPKLWEIWYEFEPENIGKRTLFIDDQLNASISQHKRWFGLFGRHTSLNLGLELLLLADERFLRSIIAHEVGHAQCQHTTGATNLHEFLETFETLFEYADPETTIVGGIVDWGLGAWYERAQGELMRVSRMNELEADLIAARLCSPQDAAETETFLATVGLAVSNRIHDPLETELLSAIRAPQPPFIRVEEQRPSLVSIETQDELMPEAWKEATSATSSHPAFRERFENVLPNQTPTAVEVGEPAAITCLPLKTFEQVKTRLTQQWVDQIETAIGIY